MPLTYAKPCLDTVNIGIVGDWPPLTAMDERGAWGIDVEFAEVVFKDANFCTHYVRLPSSARALEEMEKHNINVALMVSYTEERAKYGVFSVPYRREIMRLYSLSKPRQQLTLEDIVSSSKTVGVSIGSYYGETLESLKGKYPNQFVRISSAKRRVEMLIKSRVDFIIDDTITANYFINRFDYHHTQEWPVVIHDNEVHFLLRKGAFSPQQITTINQSILKFKPTIEKLIERYLIEAKSVTKRLK
ncbi:substrate-binding periplasmic protein (plasmid) [Pseudoalteromonas sp. T1lg65]|uniref:substrate-binding periplasmic protein n=1 Tax=Pseudoalteromonas sp. T1lg65 TaxID=2077101 RepID=UPI003F79429D